MRCRRRKNAALAAQKGQEMKEIIAELSKAGITNLFTLDFFNWCFENGFSACALREDLLAYGKRRFEYYAQKNR